MCLELGRVRTTSTGGLILAFVSSAVIVACHSSSPDPSPAADSGTGEAGAGTSTGSGPSDGGSTTDPSDSTSGGFGEPMEYVGYWRNSGFGSYSFTSCGANEAWSVVGVTLPDDYYDCNHGDLHMRVIGILMPGGSEEERPVLHVTQQLEGPCSESLCDGGGDPSVCWPLEEFCWDPSPWECDLFAQDCPEGEKCMPWANDGGSAWNATRCAPIADDPGQPGDRCTVEGSGVSGVDDCDIGSMCWNVDPKTNAGECVSQCTGDESNLQCPERSACLLANDGALSLCLPECQPLMPFCLKGQGCVPTDVVGEFVCVPAPSTDILTPGTCADAGGCGPGMACLPAPWRPEGCEAELDCCTTWCDPFAMPDPGCPPKTACQRYFDLPDLGLCVPT